MYDQDLAVTVIHNEEDDMSGNSKARKFEKEVDDARTMLASELMAKIVTLAPVALSSDKVVGIVLNREIAWELVKQAQVIVLTECKCNTSALCRHAQASAFIDNIHGFLEALDAKENSRIIKPGDERI